MEYEKEKRRIYDILLALHPDMDEKEISTLVDQISNDPDFGQKHLCFIDLIETRLMKQQKREQNARDLNPYGSRL